MTNLNKKTKDILLSGMRPTGPLHLGHFVGALENWLTLQDEFVCFFLISDYHSLGNYLDRINSIKKAVYEITLAFTAKEAHRKK